MNPEPITSTHMLKFMLLLNTVLLNAVLLNVVLLNVVLLNAVLLNVVLLNAVLLNAVLLNAIPGTSRLQRLAYILPPGQKVLHAHSRV